MFSLYNENIFNLQKRIGLLKFTQQKKYNYEKFYFIFNVNF